MREERPGVTQPALREGALVGIIAEVRLYREGLATILQRYPGLTVVWTASGLDDAAERAAEGRATAAVLDIATYDSLRIIRVLRKTAPSLAVIAFAAHELDHEIIACAEAGVAGFVPCDSSVDDLAAAILGPARGELRCTARAAAVVFRRVAAMSQTAPPTHGAPLTSRELEILDLLDLGLSNKDIARRLHIEVATVKNHVHHVLAKLHVTTRTEAAAHHRARALSRSARRLVSHDEVDGTGYRA